MRVRFAEGEDELLLEVEGAEGEGPKRFSVKRGEAVDVPTTLGKQLLKQGWEEAERSKPGAKDGEA